MTASTFLHKDHLKSLQISANASFLLAVEFVIPNEFVAVELEEGLPQISFAFDVAAPVPELQGSEEPNRLLFVFCPLDDTPQGLEATGGAAAAGGGDWAFAVLPKFIPPNESSPPKPLLVEG